MNSVASLPLPFPAEATDQGAGGSRRELKSVPFISYLSALQKTQLLTDDVVSGVEIRCEEKGSCPPGCHLCHHQTVVGGASGRGHASNGGGGGGGNGRRGEQPPPTPVLLEVSRVVPLYSLVQENVTKEVRKLWQSPVSVCDYLQGSKVIARLPPGLYVVFTRAVLHSLWNLLIV